MDKIFSAILISFTVGVLVSPFVIRFAKKMKANQTIYEYVDMHKKKQGTPTMGGIAIILSLIVGSICSFRGDSSLAYITLLVTVTYGIIGFLDDFIKIVLKRNLGLRAYQKIIGQVSIAVIVSIFAYKSGYIGSEIFLPFSTIRFSVGWWFVPICMFIFIATVNSVNLTDGLDGLASGVSLSFLIGFTFIVFLIHTKLASGMQAELILEQQNLMVVCGAGIGSLLAYLIFNCYPASIFMGDTGSLALGGLISCLAIFLKQPFLIVILGACFVATALSVCMQVGYYKLTKKRIFLMAPLHHHFEKKGCNETKIAVIYITITMIIGVGGILLTLLLA